MIVTYVKSEIEGTVGCGHGYQVSDPDCSEVIREDEHGAEPDPQW